MNFKEALRKQAEADRFLRPIELMQTAIYGRSYIDEGEKSLLETDETKLSEAVAAMYYRGEVEHGRGFDIRAMLGETVESKFRRLGKDKTSSAFFSTLPHLLDKDADKLFFLVYNPCLRKLDAFEYTKEEYKSGPVTVRWSEAKRGYTEKGGEKNQIFFPDPLDLHNMNLLLSAQRRIEENSPSADVMKTLINLILEESPALKALLKDF